MYNPEFWEIPLDHADLAKFSNESGIWFESGEDREDRYVWEDRGSRLVGRVYDSLSESLTPKQREAVILYFAHGKTQQEIADIMGISRRVVSQHLFGICRNGKQIGGAINKIRKICARRGLDIRLELFSMPARLGGSPSYMTSDA
ncbi:MAG: transcriptional regulator [candidate division Zixibacteria bacterium]|nr:transcriptional regulator [candidate division Zixibacteria bacterium]